MIKIDYDSKLLNIILCVGLSNESTKDDEDKINWSIEELFAILRQFQLDEDALDIRISIMCFSEDARWEVSPTPIMECLFNSLNLDRRTRLNYGKAYMNLNEKMSRKEFMNYQGKIAQPIIFMITDGVSSSGGFDEELNKLCTNGWFINSQRFVVLTDNSIEDNHKRKNVEHFVSNSNECILGIEDMLSLASDYSPIQMGPKYDVKTDQVNWEAPVGFYVEDFVFNDDGNFI